MLYERFNKPSNTTLIEELDSKSHQQPVTDKFIRNTHQVPSESGMMRYPQHVENFTLYEQSDSQLPPQQLAPLWWDLHALRFTCILWGLRIALFSQPVSRL